MRLVDVPESQGLPTDSASGSSSQHRTSLEIARAASISRWQDTPTVISEPEVQLSLPEETPQLIDGTFDESILRSLCDIDVSFPNF
jgi:hypothetical protein